MAYIDQVFSMTPAAIGKSLSNVVLMLVYRHRRWNSIKTAPAQRLLILYGNIWIYNNIILQYMRSENLRVKFGLFLKWDNTLFEYFLKWDNIHV